MKEQGTMKIAVACGGTGGHIFPGLATAQVLRDAGHEVTLWMAGKAVEATATAHWTGPVERIHSEGLPSGFSLQSLRAGWMLVQAELECRRRMRTSLPDALLAMGSYASVGPVLAAASLKIPVILHESNVIPGKAIHWLARWATAIGIGFPETAEHLKHPRLVLTGMPLRREIESVRTAHYPDGLDRHLFTFLVMGGSGGAHRLNELASEAFVLLQKSGKAFQVIHLTGPADETVLFEKYRAHGVLARVKAFDHDMTSLYHASDFAVCRSGAATCAELAIYGMPTLFVPYPFAASNHQLENARVMAAAGMADVREESELTANGLAEYLADRMASRDRIASMSAAAKRCARHRAAEALADLVCTVARERADRGRKATC